MPFSYDARLIMKDVPAADDFALVSTDRYIIADDHKLDTIGLVGVCSGILLLRQTEIEDITSVVSGEWRVRTNSLLSTCAVHT